MKSENYVAKKIFCFFSTTHTYVLVKAYKAQEILFIPPALSNAEYPKADNCKFFDPTCLCCRYPILKN